MKEYRSLSHTRWDCKYHIVFIPKRRKKRILLVCPNCGADMRIVAFITDARPSGRFSHTSATLDGRFGILSATVNIQN